MSKIIFHKMHGLGNDFVIIDRRISDVALTNQDIIKLTNRKTGIGCDQLIIIDHSELADCKMQIYNQDASLAEACGNATRCVAYLYKTKSIETKVGILTTEVLSDDQVKVSMGKPTFHQPKIGNFLEENLIKIVYLSIGNPHLIFIVKDLEKIDLIKIGTDANQDSYYTNGVNVSIVRVVNDHHIELRVFERGVGPTLSCGSAACASFVACSINNLVGDCGVVTQAGGDLKIQWKNNQDIFMEGPATYVYKGEII
jgi:diaminopimelate epimerase